MNLIMASFAGSHLYGTTHSDSDVDIRGICHQPIESLLGTQGFEQFHPSGYTAEEFSSDTFGVVSDDITIYGVNKFFKLCLKANPNILELLFIPPSKTLFTSHIWKRVLYNRHLFLSTKVIHTFAGYAYAQLKKIHRHKDWLDNPPEKPNPYDYGLVIETEKGHRQWTEINQKNQYRKDHRHWKNYQTWLKNRNPARAKLEEMYRFDTKHAAHLYRLILEAEELLLTGKIQLPLRDELRQVYVNVLNGVYSYEEVERFGKNGRDRLLALESKSVLPKRPDHKKAEKLLIEINSEYLYNTHYTRGS